MKVYFTAALSKDTIFGCLSETADQWRSYSVELTDSSYIQSSAGYLSTINYKGKGYFSGKSHTFKATVGTSASHSTYHIEGQWTDKSTYVKGTKGSKAHEGDVFLDVAAASARWKPVTVKPIAEQGEMESRRIWQKVAEGIKKGDFDTASTAKAALENAQRTKRKEEQAAGQTWQLTNFTYVADDADYKKLAAKFGGKVRCLNHSCFFRRD